MSKKFVIIDGNSLINRAYFGIKPPMITKEGLHTTGVYGFLNMLAKFKKEYRPGFIGVTFDVKAPTFRHEAYKEYKAGRKPMDNELAMQMPILKDVLSAMNVKMLEIAGFEADDLLGTMSKLAEEAGYMPIIVTGDKDALQLASDKTTVDIVKTGGKNSKKYTREVFEEEYGFTPTEFIDYKANLGDSSDNIPGVKGIGEKGASQLIREYGSIENIYDKIDEIPVKFKKKLEAGELSARMSKSLATINRQVPMEFEISEYEVKEPDYTKLIPIYRKLEFKSFLSKIDVSLYTDAKIDLKEYKTVLVQDEMRKEEFLQAVKDAKKIGIKTVDSDADEKLKRNNPLVGFFIENTVFGVFRDDEATYEAFEIITGENKEIFGHQIKCELIAIMDKFESEPRKDERIKSNFNFNIIFDTAVSQYLINSSANDYSIYGIGKDDYNLNLDLEREEGQLGFLVDSDFVKKDLENLSRQFSLIEHLLENDRDELEKAELTELFYNLEIPLIEVMAFMEYIGVQVDRKTLKNIGNTIETRIDHLSGEIYAIAGEEFNIKSPSQLGVILFEKMRLTPGKKTKTGYSTNAEILEKIREESPIIDKIMEYRKLTKLKGTYVDGLIPLIRKDGRIHSHFNQTVTTTGRISSSNPNMQNIPIRDEFGKLIREAFVARAGSTLVGADYSQIELRVLAHLSGDEALIESFNEGEDIHKSTAARVMGINIDDVTPIQRSNAKAINFGVIYGMGAFSLSEDLDISWKEAEKYIDDYFGKHGKVKAFMDEQIRFCRENHFVKTILGRKRYIKEIDAKNFMVRKAGERLAMNTPIQGSAADIIKLAMIKVYEKLKKMKSNLILQVHDELIIETHMSELDEVKSILKKSMEEAIALKVHLSVHVNEGKNWLQLK